MEFAFTYFNELEFDDSNRFTLRFSQNNELKKIFFQQKRCFITSIICHLKLETNITNKKKNKQIKELSKIAKKLEKNGFDSFSVRIHQFYLQYC